MKRTHASHACERCRRQRKKCDGKQPCKTCQQLGCQCSYTLIDKRLKERRPAADVIADLRIRKQVLDHIWHAASQGKDSAILDRIRSGTSLQEIVEELWGEEAADQLLTSPESTTTTVADTLESLNDDINVILSTREDHLRAKNEELSSSDAFENWSSIAPVELTSANVAVLGTDTLASQLYPATENSIVQQSLHEGDLPKYHSLPLRNISHRKLRKSSVGVRQDLLVNSLRPTVEEPYVNEHWSQNTISTSLRQPSSEKGLSKNRLRNELVKRQRMSAYPGQSYSEHSRSGQGAKVPFLSAGATRTFGNLPFSAAVTANHFPGSEQTFQLRNFRLPIWQVIPSWEVEKSSFSRVYTDFYHLGKKIAADTRSGQHLNLIDATLLFRKRRPTDAFNSDNWGSELEASFVESLNYIPTLAGTYMLARLMRWLLYPTPETYAAVPAMMRPTLRQRMKSHPAFIDVIAFPSVRDVLLDEMRDFLGAVAHAGLDLNWPYTVNEALVCVRLKDASGADVDEQIFISPQFAAHVSNSKNWVFGQSILSVFPELERSEITISEQDVVIPVERWL